MIGWGDTVGRQPIEPESVVELERAEVDVRDADTYVDAADPDPEEYRDLPDLVADGYSWGAS